MKNQSKLQFIGAAIIMLMLLGAKARAQQSFTVNPHCGSRQFGPDDSVHVTSRYQTVWFELIPPDTGNFHNSQVMEHIYTDENNVRVVEIVPQGEGQWLWHTSSYAGKYRVRSYHNNYKAFEIIFYIKKQY